MRAKTFPVPVTPSDGGPASMRGPMHSLVIPGHEALTENSQYHFRERPPGAQWGVAQVAAVSERSHTCPVLHLLHTYKQMTMAYVQVGPPRISCTVIDAGRCATVHGQGHRHLPCAPPSPGPKALLVIRI